MATVAEQVSEQYLRIQNDRNSIRAWLVNAGLVATTATLDECTTAIAAIINQGAVNEEVQEGESYTVPAGLHNGSGVVKGVAGGGNYTLQEKTVTPTKQQQAITSDSGYYGLSGVTVKAIPENYQDVSDVTAEASHVLAGKIFVQSDGTVVPGTMPNKGKVTKTLDTSTVKYVISAGYYDDGSISISLEEKTVTPTKSQQVITPAAGKVLSKVVVAAIPDEYQDVSEVDAIASDVLAPKKIVDADGNVVTGTIVNNGATNLTFDPLTQSSVDIPAGYTSGGSITMTDDLLNALKSI